MGNRATIAFAGTNPAAPSVYLHWNGGLCSVEAFLDIVRLERDAINPSGHLTPGAARDAFARAALAFIGGSVYVGPFHQCDTDNGDNGTYIVDSNLDIVGRQYVPDEFVEEADPKKRAAIAAESLAKIDAMGREAYYAQLLAAV